MKLVIYATHSDGMYDILLELLSKYGYSVDILGWGDKWEGFHNRTLKLYNHISKMDPETLVVCVDGFDTLVLNTPEILYNRFISMNTQCLWSCEYDNIGYKKYIFGGILNGGMYMGYAKALSEVYKTIIDEYGTNSLNMDDQKIINSLYKRNVNNFKSKIKLDVHNLIFANISYENPINYITNTGMSRVNYITCGERIVNRKTKIQPVFLSGPGNINMKQFLNAIGYDDNYPKRPYYIKNILKNFKLEVGLGITICIITLGLILFLLRFKKY